MDSAFLLECSIISIHAVAKATCYLKVQQGAQSILAVLLEHTVHFCDDKKVLVSNVWSMGVAASCFVGILAAGVTGALQKKLWGNGVRTLWGHI